MQGSLRAKPKKGGRVGPERRIVSKNNTFSRNSLVLRGAITHYVYNRLHNKDRTDTDT